MATQAQTSSSPESAAAGQMLQKQLQQIAGGQPVLQNVASAAAAASNNTANNPSKFQQCIAEGDLDFVSFTYIIFLTIVTYLYFCSIAEILVL